jgi:cytidylate kinase
MVRLVTVSASYGAGGSVVAPELARRLGVPFLHRATTNTGEPLERLAPEEADGVPASRLLASFTHAMPVGPTQSPLPSHHHDASLRQDYEEEIHALAADGAGVILGRGAAVVLGKSRGFHVRLDGPPEARLAQGAEIEQLSEEDAREHMAIADKARVAYVRRLYRTDPVDPVHYHLVIDSTAIPLDAVTELILKVL